MNSPGSGVLATHDADGRVTDSAAAAYGFRLRAKTAVGRLPVDPKGQRFRATRSTLRPPE
jgi:alkaline phosphatase